MSNWIPACAGMTGGMMKITSVRIAYLLAYGERIVGPYTWSAENGYTVTVDDLSVAANLLTYPRPDFVLAADEPLLREYTAEQVTKAVIDQALSGNAATDNTPARGRRKKKPLED